MDNEINENNNKSNQDTFENPPKISFYKINYKFCDLRYINLSRRCKYQ